MSRDGTFGIQIPGKERMPDPRRGEFKTTAGRNPHFFIKGLPSDFSLLGDVGGDWNMTFMTFHTLGTIIPN